MHRRSLSSHVPFALMLAAGFHFDPEGAPAPAPAPAPAAGSDAALRDEFGRAHKEATDLIAAAATGSRDLSAEERQANDKRFDRMKVIQGIIADRAKFAKIAADVGNVQAPATVPGQGEFDRSEGRSPGGVGADGDKFNLEAYKTALNRFARTGERSRELFATTTATGTGAYLPKAVGLPIAIRRQKNAFRNALAAAGYMPIEIGSPVSFSLPVGDDTANSGQAQTEGATSGTVLDESDASLSFSPTLYSSKQKWFSNTIILANTFDVAAYVVPMLQTRLDRIQQSTWTTLLKTMTTGANALAGASAMTYAELLTWEHSLLPEYRDDAVFLVADSLWKLLRGMVDDNNRPIIDLDPSGTFIGKIHNKPIIVDDSLDATGTVAHTIGAFASADAIKIVDAGDQRITRYANDPAHPDQTGFEVFQNGDCKFVQKGLILLTTPAS